VKNNFFISVAGIILAAMAANGSAGQTIKNQALYSNSANSNPADSDNYNLNGKAVRDLRERLMMYRAKVGPAHRMDTL
jgi:hypothetical protein